jgi:sulfite reductase alpha subunit-like flavoprotein
MTEKLINLATWRFVQSHNKEFKIGDEFTGGYDLEFLTRGHLLSQPAEIRNSHEVRQNNLDGSSLLLEIEPLINKTYKTAGNLAVYPENDPEMVEKVARHFNLDMNALYEVEFDKKCKLPFCTPISMRTLLTSCIDLQRPVTKSLLKNLGKLPSRDPKYFQDNSSVKTTKEYSRLTSTMHYLFKFIEHYQDEMTFETFVSLSDAIAPRLFTIASSPLVYPTSIHIVDSLEDEGLCSKFFKRNPK